MAANWSGRPSPNPTPRPIRMSEDMLLLGGGGVIGTVSEVVVGAVVGAVAADAEIEPVAEAVDEIEGGAKDLSMNTYSATDSIVPGPVSKVRSLLSASTDTIVVELPQSVRQT